MIKELIGYALLALGFLTVFFFGKYNGTYFTYPTIYFITGIIMIFFGGKFIQISFSDSEKQDIEKWNILIDELKLNGEKIKVDLSICEIKSNDYIEEQEITAYSNIKGWNVMGGEEMKNVKNVTIYQRVIIYKHKNKENIETFESNVFNIDNDSLLIKLYDRKETYIYVDKNNRERYYFDLAFLVDDNT